MNIFFKKIIRYVFFVGILFSLWVIWFSLGGETVNMSIHRQTALVSDTHSEVLQKFSTESSRVATNDQGTMVFVGDIMLSRGIGTIMEKQELWNFPFEHVKEYLNKADLVFGNLEGPISGRGKHQGSIYSFNASPYAVAGLIDGNIGVLSLANNHIFDYGSQAFLDTLALLDSSGIQPVGAGVNYEEAHYPVIRKVKNTRVAFLAYTNLLPRSLGTKDSIPAISYLDEEIMKRDIEEAKKRADIVVVSFHWGDEYETKHNRMQERIAHAAIDVGATLIIGHHPHVVQEVEEYGGGYIAYSLGNFIFDQNFSPDTSKGLLLEVKIDNKKISGIRTLGVSFNALFQPSIIESHF